MASHSQRATLYFREDSDKVVIDNVKTADTYLFLYVTPQGVGVQTGGFTVIQYNAMMDALRAHLEDLNKMASN